MIDDKLEKIITVNEIKDELRKLGLKLTGNKKALFERLKEAKYLASFSDRELRAKVLLESNGIVGNCGTLRTREQFDSAISEMGGLDSVFEIFQVKV